MRRLTAVFVTTLLLFALLLPAVFAQEAPSIEVSDQDVTDAGTVTVDSVSADAAGWVVIHENACTDDAGTATFGDVIGQTAVDAGDNTDVEVTLDEGVTMTAGDQLCAMLHEDTEPTGEYNFPDGDGPVQDAEGNIVMTSFNVGAAAQEATATPTTEAEADTTPTVEADEGTPTATAEVDDMDEMTPTATAEAPGTLPETGGNSGTPSGLLLAVAALMILLGGGMVMYHLATHRA